MYFYQTYYNDSTWDILASKTAINSPQEVCKTCDEIKEITATEYFLLKCGEEV